SAHVAARRIDTPACRADPATRASVMLGAKAALHTKQHWRGGCDCSASAVADWVSGAALRCAATQKLPRCGVDASGQSAELRGGYSPGSDGCITDGMRCHTRKGRGPTRGLCLAAVAVPTSNAGPLI